MVSTPQAFQPKLQLQQIQFLSLIISLQLLDSCAPWQNRHKWPNCIALNGWIAGKHTTVLLVPLTSNSGRSGGCSVCLQTLWNFPCLSYGWSHLRPSSTNKELKVPGEGIKVVGRWQSDRQTIVLGPPYYELHSPTHLTPKFDRNFWLLIHQP